jgi:hypothetical protein
MGWFKRYQDRVLVKPQTQTTPNKTADPKPTQTQKTPTAQPVTQREFDTDALKHAGLFRGWTEKPIAVAGVRQHRDQLFMLSQKVIDVAPAWVIADPTPDNPDAMRVEALGLSIGTIPKAMSKRIRKLGDCVPAMVLLNTSNYDYYGQNTGAPIKAEVVVKGIQ